ncbi:Conjugative transfer ATPase PilU in PFGI-1-like cluster [Metapseudomonas furukawaii]|nr:Twitching motility protein PilT [Pseudomonas furukawaii]ELS27555.1 Conjugative transfer ATPase PilU in PFGI-1-like cluster [Pseudomonas furukawaii]
MGVGKTTTGASFVVERLKLFGGMALAIEDPTETNINGVHGEGRCIAISASRYNGGYKEHLVRGLRSGVDFFFIGEIRDEETAFEALKAGTNGKLIFATLHASNITTALERMITLASQYSKTAAETLSESLLAVIWQNLEETPKQGGGTFKRFTSSSLVLSGEDAYASKEKIRRNELGGIDGDVERQAARAIWGRD